jgi:hypothetical protein
VQVGVVSRGGEVFGRHVPAHGHRIAEAELLDRAPDLGGVRFVLHGPDHVEAGCGAALSHRAEQV